MIDFEERRWISGDGLSLYGRDYAGAGGAARLPIVCLHGLTRNSRDFEEFAPWAASLGRRVLALDMRGRGLSDWDPQPERYTPKTYVHDVLAVLDALDVERAIFVGTSMGGIITMALAAAQPDRVSAAVLNDVGPEIASEGIERIKSYVGGRGPISSWSDAADYVQAINGVAFPDYSDSDWDRFSRRLFREDGDLLRLDYDPAIAIQMRDDNYKAADRDAWQQFTALAKSRPTLLVRGSLSDLLSPSIAQRMQDCAPTMRYVEVPRVGHAPMLTEPEATRAIGDFLRDLP